ncbi:hypothetical protein [Thiobacillus denitrificans]|uniref:hypothetical protein n=1 Tax=Thiobacillus denitrificans TaxID=36861 RepID=UPI00059CA0BA|nr:hypothetical protein [Thiobacillus denitrificans]
MPHESETMTFARAADGRTVHIDEVANGLGCGCVCLKCGGKLLGRHGDVRQHHFSHYLAIEGLGCTETALHKAAKEIIQQEKRVALPPQLEGIGLHLGSEVCFESVSLEHRLGSGELATEIVADAYGQGFVDMVIEIAVHHRVDQDKAEKTRRLGLPAVEIDLGNAMSQHLDWAALRYAVMVDLHRRRWINLPVPEPATAKQIDIASAPPIWQFNIRGTPVVARKLPIRNVSVWHSFDPRVRGIVEGACRGRGWWNKKYRNWVVFDRFWPEVFATLQALDQQIN